MNLKNKKIFITGAEGFIGSHLLELLIKEGAQITSMVQYNSFNKWGWIDTFSKEIKDNMNIVLGDIRDFDGLNKIIRGNEIIFHLAALIAIPYSYQSPMAYVKTNIEGTLNVLESARVNGLEKIIHTSTSETYGTAEYVPIDEKHPLKGQSPYSASKIAADKIAESYFCSYNLPIVTARPFNTYGPRQSARAIIPTIISQILSGQKKIYLGDLTPTRDFNYVKDTARGFIEISKSDEVIGEVLNIGTGQEISMHDLVKKIIEIIGTEVEIIRDESRIRPQKSEVKRLLASNKKIIEKTNWKPEYTIEDGLEETINWIRNNMDIFKSNLYTV